MENKQFIQLLEQQQQILTYLTGIVGKQPTTMVPPFQPFNSQNETWNTYVSRVKEHLKAHSVSESLYKPLLLTWIGTDSYQLYEKLFSEEERSNCTFDDIINKLQEYLAAQDHEVSALVKFSNCQMKPDQSYSQWAAELESLARKCNFTCDSCKASYSSRIIRDLMILHTPHPRVQGTCIDQMKPTLQDVINIGDRHLVTKQAVATIKQDVSNGNPDDSTVHQLKPNYPRHKKKDYTKPKNLPSCINCFINHSRESCRYRKHKCDFCKRIGHTEDVCLKKNGENNSRFNQQSQQRNDASNVINIQAISTIKRNNGMFIRLLINSKEVTFQLDTGSAKTIIDQTTYVKIGRPPLSTTSVQRTTYGGTKLLTLGECFIHVKINKKVIQLRAIVVRHTSAGNLLGMDWLAKFGTTLKINEDSFVISNVNCGKEETCFSQHPNLFSKQLGRYRYGLVKLHVEEAHSPSHLKPRPVPFALFETVKNELSRLESLGVISKVNHSDWATPIVIVRKEGNKVRLCGDYKATINKALKVDQYPIPKPEELYLKLQGGQLFSKIDLSDAYFQLELDEDSQKLTTITTVQGLYQYKRLPFGIASAPAIFQKIIEQLVADLPGAAAYLDDIIVTGKTTEDHTCNLNRLFDKLSKAGFTSKKEKCQLFQNQVTYLGHIIDSKGIRPSEENVKAIKLLPAPTNVSQLMSFLGKAEFYRKFIPNLANIAEPLNDLRRASKIFKWTKSEAEAFDKIKHTIVNATRLTHYDPKKVLILATDASSVGVGAVILHRMDDGSELPIAHASKTLSQTQRNYSQIEKEALSIIYGIKKFHQYLYGREFIIITDHQPLVSLFCPTRKTNATTTQRLQRWALLLSNYLYTLEYRSTTKHGNADALSRLPVGVDEKFDQEEEREDKQAICFVNMISTFPINFELLQDEGLKDSEFEQLSGYIVHGWPKSVGRKHPLRNYYNIRNALSTKDGIVFMDAPTMRPIIPKQLRKSFLKQLHDGHWGMEKMKSLARRTCYWPKMSHDIEEFVKTCDTCRKHSDNPPRQYQPWPRPSSPWERVHIDYAGLFKRHYWFFIVDAYSKYPYICCCNDMTAETTCKILDQVFTIEGFPKTLVSDNGPQLISKKVEKYLISKGIDHITSPPYHPASNGQAERFVRSFKKSMTKLLSEEQGLNEALSTFLRTYRFTPSMDGLTPAEKLHGIRSPKLPSTLGTSQSHISKFYPNDKIYYRAGENKIWKTGVVRKKIAKTIYLVDTPNGTLKLHQNQLIRKHTRTLTPSVSLDDVELLPNYTMENRRYDRNNPEEANEPLALPVTPPDSILEETSGEDSVYQPDQRPKRVRRRPSYLRDFINP